jgi:pyruvate,water dikinase
MEGGQTASAGVGAGPVYIVRRDADALGFPAGAVLVAAQALPRWASLLDRAAAVVTEQGGIAGHLANVAREFGVPALMGIEGALASLADRQTVTVDADGRRIYHGRVQALLAVQPAPARPMAGSPVYETLRRAADHILPLNLIDPDSPAFRLKNCRTLHDITRYCHEKAVHQMFSFGKHHDFPERSSKQLFTRVPMQWWVLDLDDGLARQRPGPYAHLEDIVSIPMLALWEGITAFAWEGPPPVDGRGMMAVMFQATANRALVPTVRSNLTNRNYFMISRHYCSLQSRLGFHFCTVEAMVGERPSENYANFCFKGGAADTGRRIQRVSFVGEILEAHRFTVSIREDALRARLEHFDQDTICHALKILGYLIIHTRQLDMVMASANSVCYYRGKLEDQIARLSAGGPSLETAPAEA